MWKNIGFEKCVSFVESEIQKKGKKSSEPIRPAVTISQMTGAGGHTVASLLADYMQSTVPVLGAWAVFDRNLVKKVLEDHNIGHQIARFMEEKHRSMVRDSVEEWMGLHPSSWNLMQKASATILQLAEMGNVILVGRGSAVITSKLENVFHVRLVASLEKRIEYGMNVYGVDQKTSINYIKKRDEGRKRYLKENYDADVDDPLLYHVIINTDLFTYEDAAKMIGNEVIRRFNLPAHVKVAKSEYRAAL
jgi:cytidylate kinase